MMKKNTYFDYAAATPMDKSVLKSMLPYFSGKFYNPSAIYLKARSVREDVNKARSSVARILGCRPAEIIFTSGATEANNLAISGVMTEFPKAEVVVSATEHESLLEPALSHNCKLIPVDQFGIVQPGALSKLITDKTVLVSVMLVNNETGVVQPLAEVARLLNEVKKDRIKRNIQQPLYFHSDLAQATNYLDVHVNKYGLDLATINGGKIYGPKQSGALFIKAGTKVRPQIVGGGQEFNLRSGTENVPNIIGFARALEVADKKHKLEAERLTNLRHEFEKILLSSVGKSQINGSKDRRAPHISSISFLGTDNERLMMELDELGLMVAVGSACSASSGEPSHVLKAMGCSDQTARSTLRISFGRQTTKKDINKLVKNLITIL